MGIGQLSGAGQKDIKIYRITMFNGVASSDRGIHFYTTKKIESINDLKAYIAEYGYKYAGSTWKFIDVSGYYSSTHASKLYLSQQNDCLLINIDSSQTNISSAIYICCEV